MSEQYRIVLDGPESYEALENAQRQGCQLQLCSVGHEERWQDFPNDIQTDLRAFPPTRYRAVVPVSDPLGQVIRDTYRNGTGSMLVSEKGVEHVPKDAVRAASPIDDESLARQIGEVGNQVHNLGCEQQNNEALSDRLAELANDLWKLAKCAPTTAPQVAVPEGWKLVPVEPTDDQFAAALHAQGDQINYDVVYAAMLAAAPTIKPDP